MTIRVLIADDQELVRTGFRVILNAEPDLEVVGESRDGKEVIEAARRLRPEVVLMDIRMPNLDGIEATRRIAAGACSPRVLILTTFDLDQYVYEALRAGASGFLLKDAAADDLLRAIRVIAAGEALLAPSITRRLIEDYARRPAPRHQPYALADLTARELEVMRLLARGMSNTDIARELFLGDATVKTHVARIFTKLSLHDRAQAVVLAYETGLVQPGDREIPQSLGMTTPRRQAVRRGGSGTKTSSPQPTNSNPGRIAHDHLGVGSGRRDVAGPGHPSRRAAGGCPPGRGHWTGRTTRTTRAPTSRSGPAATATPRCARPSFSVMPGTRSGSPSAGWTRQRSG